MGFLLGYALSLFGRPQDRLSHVLVDQAFETHPEFFYPPKMSRVLTTREGRPINATDARVLLADIPIVRLRLGLPRSCSTARPAIPRPSPARSRVLPSPSWSSSTARGASHATVR